MKSKFMTLIWAAVACAALVALAPAQAAAQEGEPVVIDSVVAQVNGDVVMLSQVKREVKEAIDAFKQQGMDEAKATEEVNKRRPELIASLINELLLVQKGKELNLTEEVETEVNREMARVMKEQNFPTVVAMEEAMRREGLDPAAIRNTIRTQYMKNAVLSREVDMKIYFRPSVDELKKYYEQNRDKFRQPEVVTLSEIFLSFAGKSEADVRSKGQEIIRQLRAGADFGTLAAANSERLDQQGNRQAVQTKGKVGTFKMTDLKPELAAALKNVQAGSVTDLIRSDEGFQILRVDERTAAGDPKGFDEEQTRQAYTIERRDKERVEYMSNLRKEAYIKVADEYKATVEPLLKTGAASTSSTTAKPGSEKQ
ncbi:MAG TPA: peptidyl-prolyl cis-trans isomerase [Pyrinomonadaceae bacterium]|nr:peptidyl-prolyl cis-trans isomerase [Pyrinomonadaceae bacterium]